MNLQKIIIYEHEVLFHILDEIKEKFNFDLFLANKKNINDIIKKLDDDYLIISKISNDEFKNNLIINSNSIKLNKLIELINLNFLKSKFNSQSDISIGTYKLNLNSREISKNNIIADLTEREVNLIIFLKDSQLPVNINKLQREVWDYGSKLETHTVETHIYRLRKKIKNKFDDDSFILSSKEGYFIEKKK
tara:strand:+ start:436 stop:1008 length:573 start_codon:yes stop_codon:yes gene_type:complete